MILPSDCVYSSKPICLFPPPSMCIVYAAMRPVRSVFPLSAQVAGSPVRLPILAAASRRSGELVSVWVGLTHTHTYTHSNGRISRRRCCSSSHIFHNLYLRVCRSVIVWMYFVVVSVGFSVFPWIYSIYTYICYKQIWHLRMYDIRHTKHTPTRCRHFYTFD